MPAVPNNPRAKVNFAVLEDTLNELAGFLRVVGSNPQAAVIVAVIDGDFYMADGSNSPNKDSQAEVITLLRGAINAISEMS